MACFDREWRVRRMDSEGRGAARLLDALWAIDQGLWELSTRLRSLPEIAAVHSGSKFRRYSARVPAERRTPWIEYHLWAELGDERGIAAWLGVHWDEGSWKVRCYAKVDHGGDRETFVLAIPGEDDTDEEDRTIDGFVGTLQSVTTRLIEAVDSLDPREL